MKLKFNILFVVCTAFISCKKDEIIKLQSITLDKTEVEMKPAGTIVLNATLNPVNAVNARLVWSSSDTLVVSVSSSGELKAKNIGTAIVTVKNVDATVSATTKVTVSPIDITSFTLNKNVVSLLLGTSDQLTVSIVPDNATFKKYTFHSADEKVVTVDQSGKITGISLGKARITVKSEDGKLEAYCDVTVNPINVTSLTLNKNTTTMLVGGNDQLTVAVIPENATNKKVTFHTSNDKIVTVDQNGKLVAVGIGKARITVKSEDGQLEAYCDVTVSPISVQGVTIKQGSTIDIYNGFNSQLTVDFKPINSTNQKVTWSSSNTNVASVSSTGLVTGKSLGTATITATSEDGSFKSSIAVTVKNPALAFSTRNVAGLVVASSVSYTLGVYFTNNSPADAIIEKVALLDGNGKILIENSDPTKLVVSVKANTANVGLTSFTSSTTIPQSWRSVVTYKVFGKRYTITTGGGSESVILETP